MKHQPTHTKGTASIADLRRIDQVCQAFESQWRAGAEPRIDSTLETADGRLRSRLLHELLLLELDYRRKRGERPTEAEYRARFPLDLQVVREAFGGGSTIASGDTHGGRSGPSLPDFPGYQVLRVLGEGGMGVVYLARQASPERTVALKVIRPDRLDAASPERRKELLDRFRVETQAASGLEHEHIVPVYEAGQFGDHPYFSMRYVEGHTLDERLRDGPLAPRDAAELLIPIARAVDYAHQRGVLHRDLKPRNVLLDHSGHGYVTDFGLAKLLDSPSGLTHTAEVLGTPSYMSPEQARGDEDLGEAADIYGLGAILYELLTGRPPFRAAGMAETLRQVIDEEPVPPRRLNRTLDKDLETVCLKCLEKAPRRRYPSALDLAEELSRCVQGLPIHARPISRAERGWRWCRRNSWAAVAIGLLLLLALGSPPVALHQRSVARTVTRQKHELQSKSDRIASLLDDTKQALGREEEAKQHAQREALAKRKALYLSDMNRMEGLWERSELGIMRELLDRHVAEPDFREFEWHYWRRQLHREVRRLNHGESVQTMAIAPDGSRLATAGNVAEGRHAVRIWDAQSGRLMRTIAESSTPVVAMSFVGEPAVLSLVTADHQHQLWNWQTGERSSTQTVFYGTGAEWSDRRREAYALAPSGRFFGVSNGSTVILRARGRTPFSDFKAVVPGVVRTRTPQMIQESRRDDGALEAQPQPLKIWQPGDPLAPPAEEDGGTVFALALSPDESLLAAGSRDGELFVWDVQTGEQRLRLPAHEDIIWDLDFAPDGQTLATASKDGSAKVWDLDPDNDGVELLATISDHDGGVRTVALGRSGMMASGGDDGTVRIFSAATGHPVALYRGHDQPVIDVAFAEPGVLWSASRDGTAKQWPLTDDEAPIAIADGTPLYCLDVAPSGQSLAAAGATNQVAVWNLGSGRLEAMLVGEHEQIFHLRHASNGKQVVAAAWDSTFTKWDVDSGQVVWERRLPFRQHVFGMPHVAISPHGKWAAGQGTDQIVRILDLESEQPPVEIPVDGIVARILFAPDAKQVLTVAHPVDDTDGVSSTAEMKLWHADSGELSSPIAADVLVSSVAFAGDGRTLTWHERDGASPDSTPGIVIWDLVEQRETSRLTLPPDVPHVWAVTASGDGQTIAALAVGDLKEDPNAARVLLVWDAATGKRLQRVRESSRFVTAAPQGGQILTAGHDGQVRCWAVDSTRQRPLYALARPSGPALGAAYLVDSQSIAVAGFAPPRAGLSQMYRSVIDLQERTQRQQIVYLPFQNWKTELFVLPGDQIVHAGSLWQRLQLEPALASRLRLAQSPFAKEAYAAESKEAFVVASTGDLLKAPADRADGEIDLVSDALKDDEVCTAVAVSPDGRRLAIATGRRIQLRDGRDLRLIKNLEGHQDYVQTLAFSSDGGLLASGGVDRTVRLWGARDGNPEAVLRGHAGSVTCLSFAPGGRTVASSSLDGTIELWDVETGQPKTTLAGHRGPVHWIGFSDDGETLASTGEDGSLRIWRADRRGPAVSPRPASTNESRTGKSTPQQD